MARSNEVAAEVSIYNNGSLYLGIRARQGLGLGYNDRVRVTIPSENGDDLTLTGCIDSSGSFTVGVGVYRRLTKESERGSVAHADAIVEPAARTWDDVNGLTQKRWDDYDTLEYKDH